MSYFALVFITHHICYPMRFFLSFLIILFSTTTLSAQDSTQVHPTKERSYSLAAFPLVFYLPETRLGFGGAGILAFRFKGEPESSRPSQLQLGGAYTLNKQVLFYLPYQLYWDNEAWIAKGELGYYRYFYNFYGVGNTNPEDFVEEYEVLFPRVRVNLQYLMRPNFYTGIRYWFDDYAIQKVASDGQLTVGDITGSAGGKVSGLGWINTLDSRDHIFFPRKGVLVEAIAFFNKPVLGSDFNFNRYTLDASTYIELPWKHVLALNAFTGFITGDAPFNELLLMGGSKRARGYYEGRFRDNSMGLVQAEYRFPLFWRLGAVAFGSLGAVADEYNRLAARHLRYNLGGGIRVLLDKKENINLRFDVGVGKNTTSYYLTIGEAF